MPHPEMPAASMVMPMNCFSSQSEALISEGIRRLAKTLARLAKIKKSGVSLSTASIRPNI